MFIWLVLLVTAELGLRVVQLFQKPAPRWVDRRYAEAAHFAGRWSEEPPRRPPPNFDPLLGWRNRPDTPGATLNGEFWRGAREFGTPKSAPRIAIAGDSFVFGSGVGDDETLVAYLQKEVGPARECLNFGVAGFGLDQISLVATEILPRYQPDEIFVAFVADDLVRSCFEFGFEGRKPYFVREGDAVVLRGVPVPTPFETWQAHQSLRTRISDLFITNAKRSRLVVLAMQPLFREPQSDCLTRVNPLILKRVADAWKNRVPVRFVHLDGELPSGFESAARALGLTIVSVPPMVDRIAQQIGVTPERLADAFQHPKPSFNRVLARALHEISTAHASQVPTP